MIMLRNILYSIQIDNYEDTKKKMAQKMLIITDYFNNGSGSTVGSASSTTVLGLSVRILIAAA